MHKEMQLLKILFKLDIITIFSLMPLQLMTIVDMVGNYYRWFNVSSKPLKDNLVLESIDEYIKNLLGLMQ